MQNKQKEVIKGGEKKAVWLEMLGLEVMSGESAVFSFSSYIALLRKSTTRSSDRHQQKLLKKSLLSLAKESYK